MSEMAICRPSIETSLPARPKPCLIRRRYLPPLTLMNPPAQYDACSLTAIRGVCGILRFSSLNSPAKASLVRTIGFKVSERSTRNWTRRHRRAGGRSGSGAGKCCRQAGTASRRKLRAYLISRFSKGGNRERLRRGIRSEVTSNRGREQPPFFPATSKLVKLRIAGKTGEHPVGPLLCPLHRGPRISPCSAWSPILTAAK